MLQRVFLRSLDNQFPGHKIALYVFYALTALTLWRSQHHLFEHDGGAQSIATIPIDTYSSSAAETVIGIFGLWGLSQLIISLIYLLAAIRYRALIPFLYVLFTFEYAMRLWGQNTIITLCKRCRRFPRQGCSTKITDNAG